MGIKTVVAAVAMATGCGNAAAESFMDIVMHQLLSKSAIAATGGYSTRGYLAGMLEPGATADWPLRVSAGQRMVVAGVCDADCTDVDLYVYDEAGVLVDQDVLDDDVPVVSFVAAGGGIYTVRVEMVICDEAPCGYGVAVLE
jgi:hypothetical protein